MEIWNFVSPKKWEPCNYNIYKKAFQSNANHPLANSPCLIVKKFENLGDSKVQIGQV